MNLKEWVDSDLRGLDGTPLPDDRLPTLQGLLLCLNSELSVKSVERLRSRKNVVLGINTLSANNTEQKYVAKLFVTSHFEKELGIIRNCLRHGLRVPEIVEADSGVCLMSFIDGVPLVDRINEAFDDSLVTMIAAWYYEFHQKIGITKGDPRLRNFILSHEDLYGLDFEEATEGHWMTDIAGIAASILDTNPIFHKKKRQLVWMLLEEYLNLLGQSRNTETDTRFVTMVANALEETAKHRNDERIMEVCRSIRARGISLE
ncbi:hypothetical protein EU546_06050 [Candidatus Thorarchaeota archaeon]|jgi:tRNA A-37 threonylcarbamoyl transferase component Bud32|nr:MAG: hypothetical protein EU546_06050 [Candidatus Thorarchaeota archaeon]